MKTTKAPNAKLEELDPFDIPLRLYHGLSSEEYRALSRRLHELYGDWIQEQFERTGAEALVLCDHQVVLASKGRYEPSDEEIEALEKRLKKPCYVLTTEGLVEEQAACPWSDLGHGDHYPTLSVHIGRRDWTDDQVFQRGTQIRCDFDTGNPDRTVLDEAVCRRVGGRSRIRREGRHLGHSYFYYQRPLKIGITDTVRQRCLEKIVEGVEGWATSWNPYRLANPRREGFVGRDLMLKLRVKIVLDPDRRESQWQLL